MDSSVAASFPARRGHYSKPAREKQVGFHMATHKDGIWVTVFESLSPTRITFSNTIQISFMSARQPAPRFSFVLDNSHKNPFDFSYGVFHMSSTLRPCVLLSAYSVSQQKTLLHVVTSSLWFWAAQQQLPHFCQASSSLLFCFHCGIWCCYCQLAGTGCSASSSAQQLLTHWNINPGSEKAKCSHGRAFY